MKKELTPKEFETLNNYKVFQKNVLIAFNEICYAAENNNPDILNIHSGISEVIIGGVTYEIQLSLISNQKSYVGESGVMFSEVVKIHD
jgi:hypothetical protein